MRSSLLRRAPWCTGHFVLFVWSHRAPSICPDWNPVTFTRGAKECCDLRLALRFDGIMVKVRFFPGAPPQNIAVMADMVVYVEPTSCEHKCIDDP